jgi:hypothetical protein
LFSFPNGSAKLQGFFYTANIFENILLFFICVKRKELVE